MPDRYHRRLQHAAWTWREGKFSRFHKRPERKDRTMGRHDKRSAKQEDRREMKKDRDD